MLKVICDKCGIEEVIGDDGGSFNAVAYTKENVSVDGTVELVDCKSHFCSDCIVILEKRNLIHRKKIDAIAAERDKIVVPEFERFKSEVDLCNKDMNKWVIGYINGEFDDIEDIDEYLSTLDSVEGEVIESIPEVCDEDEG